MLFSRVFAKIQMFSHKSLEAIVCMVIILVVHTDMAQVVEILSRVRQELTCST